MELNWADVKSCIEYFRKSAKKLNPDKLRDIVLQAAKNAIKKNHRRMFILSSDSIELIAKTASDILYYYSKVRREKIEILFVGYKPDLPPESFLYGMISSKIENARFQKISFDRSVIAMGRTYDVVIISFIKDVPPNDIGRLVETVRGGGFIIFAIPPLEKWPDLKTEFYHYIVTINWTLEDVKGRFIKRIIKKLFEHDGIYVFDLDNNLILKEAKEEETPKRFVRRKPKMPKKTRIPLEVYEIALTNDQVRALEAMECLLGESGKKRETKVCVLTADRGRGKSAAVGMFLGAIAKKFAGKGPLGRFFILVTAPREYNVYTLFEFAEKTLRRLGENPKLSYSPLEIRGKGYVISYVPPSEAPKIARREKAEYVAVDEAAGIPVPVLFKILESARKVIYSSTIHGYEGAGRGFSVRFLKVLKEERKDIELHHIEMEEPIRYAPNDPIEKWLFDTLLLDAEPAELTEEDYKAIEKLDVKLERVDLDEWLLGKKEDDLRQFIGIYVFAHYRNQPKDLALLADAPHYEAYVLRLSTGKIVTALLVAKEGGLPVEAIEEIYRERSAEPSGHLIPVAIEKHYRDMNFPRLWGYRIVRIATHPKVMRRGLGSKALELFIQYAIEKGFAWIGAGFGANVELMRFWLKNDFVPLHVSPKRNPVSGEYTTIVVRPLAKELEPLIREYYREFRIRFVDWLRYVHYDMEPELARVMLKGVIFERIEKPYHYTPRLTTIQKKRLLAYLIGILSYELASDAILELIKAYFIDEDPNKPELDEEVECILISKVLQARTWGQVRDMLRIPRRKAVKLFRRAIRKLYNYFIERETERRERELLETKATEEELEEAHEKYEELLQS